MAVDCAGLQAELDGAAVGATVTVDEGLVCAGPYTLPPRRITLQGEGTGATIDGGGLSRALEGTDVGSTAVQNLTFTGGYSAGSGGAVAITGASEPSFVSDQFYGNTSEADGGALSITSDLIAGATTVAYSTFGDGTPENANVAARGGALYVATPGTTVEITRSYFTGNNATNGYGGALYLPSTNESRSVSFNLFGENHVTPTAGGEAYGGGAYVALNGTATDVSQNVFDANVLEPAATAAAGAGLEAYGENYAAVITQFGNIFRANQALDSAPDVVPQSLTGGGEHVFSAYLQSVGDRFVGNTLGQQAGAAGGAGVSLTGCQFSGLMLIQNGVFVQNSAAGSTAGSAIQLGCATPVVSLTLQSSTIAANLPATVPGIGGDGNDKLSAVNSILGGGTAGTTDVDGFASRSITYSDACDTGSAHAGTGNICTQPNLVDTGLGPYSELPNAPTIDVGSNAAVPANLVHDVDFTDGRIVDGNGDGVAITDMGADEYQPRFVANPGPEPPPIFDSGGVPVVFPPSEPAAPAPAQVVAGARKAAPKKARKCGDRYGPTSRFLNKLSKSARLAGGGITITGTARYRKCKGSKNGTVKRVNFTIRLVDGKTCRSLTAKRTLGTPSPCARKARLVRAKGTRKWRIVVRGPLPDGRYLAQVQAVDNLGNRERASSHRNFRHFRIDGGRLRQGWHGTQPDDYTKR